MTNAAGLIPVQPTPTGLIRAVQERLDALERDLAAARSALSVAEVELLAIDRRPMPEPVALTTDQVAERQATLWQRACST
jgi:hypothetical protein